MMCPVSFASIPDQPDLPKPCLDAIVPMRVLRLQAGLSREAGPRAARSSRAGALGSSLPDPCLVSNDPKVARARLKAIHRQGDGVLRRSGRPAVTHRWTSPRRSSSCTRASALPSFRPAARATIAVENEPGISRSAARRRYQSGLVWPFSACGAGGGTSEASVGAGSGAGLRPIGGSSPKRARQLPQKSTGSRPGGRTTSNRRHPRPERQTPQRPRALHLDQVLTVPCSTRPSTTSRVPARLAQSLKPGAHLRALDRVPARRRHERPYVCRTTSSSAAGGPAGGTTPRVGALPLPQAPDRRTRTRSVLRPLAVSRRG